MADFLNDRTPSVYRLSISAVKGQKKQNVKKVEIIAFGGINGDAHAGTDRAVSLLPYESIVKFKQNGMDINPGDFAENITTVGVNFEKISIGTKIALGSNVILEVVQIGKECHDNCTIKQIVDDCIMPREGVFARALEGGELCEGDTVRILG